MSLENTLSEMTHLDRGATLAPGERIADRYEVIRHLGTGGSSEVYLCSDLEQPQREKIAVKLMSHSEEELFGPGVHEVNVARFLDEVKISRILSHPNIIQVHELIRTECSLAFTMEHIEGDNLAELIASNSSMPIANSLYIFREVAKAVSFMHSLGIIHRDIKPDNILRAHDGRVKVIDFGTARMEGSLGIQGEIAGTLSYLSPEYLKDGQLDNRSDIYSLGMVAYEIVTGSLPFTCGGVIQTLQMRLSSDPPAPNKKNCLCPPELSNIILKTLERDPEQRYQNAAQVIEELDRYFPEVPVKSEATSISRKNSSKSQESTALPTEKANQGFLQRVSNKLRLIFAE
ncbi:MAG: serine/threonine-protein kinase [bacterium]|nr:serine/threonine-protein kinase [bacterium]